MGGDRVRWLGLFMVLWMLPSVRAVVSATTVWNRDGAVMVCVPGGTFEMGWSEAEARAAWAADVALWSAGPEAAGWPKPQLADYLSATPRHRVTLSTFWMDADEVTNAQFTRYVAATGARPAEDVREPVHGRPDHPVLGVSWRDARGYAAWAGKRLPSEAEWEYAARGTDGRAYPWGNDWDPERANVAPSLSPSDGYALSAPVRSYPSGASPFGILDLCGNAMEWVEDAWSADYYAHSAAIDPPGPESGDFRILRGGGWRYLATPGIYRTAYRQRRYLGDRALFVGFRCVADTSR